MLASETDIFVDDSFGTSHRAIALRVELLNVLLHRAPGGLMERVLAFHSKLLRESARPQAVLIGNSGIARKPRPIQSLVKLMHRIFVAGAVALTLLVARDYPGCQGVRARREEERRINVASTPL